jgi:glycine/D-amino acid oxidase-like deaminating enzyme
LYAWRGQLISQQVLRAETFERAQLIVSGDGVRYQDIKAEYIIFADGAAAFDNPWFGLLPFSLNKGEALVVRIPQLLPDYIYKKGLTLVPLMNERGAHEALYWVGSSYQNQFADALPSAAFRESTVAQLRQWLRMDFTVEDHKAGVRPATVERRPFVGLHPQHLRVGILNGMGTKGCSLAPYFAWQLVQHLQTGAAIVPEADVQRFRRVLGKV